MTDKSYPNFVGKCKSLDEKVQLGYKAIIKLNEHIKTMNIPRIKLSLVIIEQLLSDNDIKDKITIIVEYFLQYDTIGTMMKIVKYCFDNDYLGNNVIYPIGVSTLVIYCNVCELSEVLCHELLSCGLIRYLINNLTNEDNIRRLRYFFSNEFRKLYSYNLINRKDKDIVYSYRVYNMMISSSFIIHNLAIYIGYKEPFNDKKLKECLIKMVNVVNCDYLGMAAYSTLAVIIKEDEINLLNVGEKYLTLLVNMARYQVRKSPDIYSEFRLWEILKWISVSLVNELLYYDTVKAGILDVCCEVLETSKKDQERYLAKLCIEGVLNSKTITRNYIMRTIDLSVMKKYAFGEGDEQEFRNYMKSQIKEFIDSRLDNE